MIRDSVSRSRLGMRLLLGVVVLGLFAGCSGGSGKDEDSIKVAYWGGPEEIGIIKDLVGKWQKKNPEIPVRLEHTPFSAYVSRLLTRIAGDVAPDIMAVEVNLFPRLWSKGAFRSLQPFIESDPHFALQEFFPEVVERFSVDGEVYAIPRDTAPFACIYYNKTLFQEAGIPFPTDDWSWEDLLAASKALTVKDERGRVQRYGFYAWAWQNFVYSNGGKFVDDLYQPTRTLLGDRKAVEGIQFYADLMNKHEVAPTPVALDNLAMGAQQLFMTQRVAMFSSGFWEVPILRRIDAFEWDVVMFPKGPGGKRAFGTGGTAYAMLASSKHPELAWEVLRALTSREGQVLLAQTGLAQPANQAVAEGPAFALNDLPPSNKHMLNDAVRYVVYEPFIPEWREIFELHIMPELDEVFHGRLSAQEAADRYVSKVNRLIAERGSSAIADNHKRSVNESDGRL